MRAIRAIACSAAGILVLLLAGCARGGDGRLRAALAEYRSHGGATETIASNASRVAVNEGAQRAGYARGSAALETAAATFHVPYLALSTSADEPTSQPSAGTQPAKTSNDTWAVRDGYWRKDMWHQAGYEGREFITKDFWRGFKTSYWNLENALLLTATMGASIAIRETGVDDTIRERVHHHRQLGEFDETIQILGNPGTHFAATGVLWLASTALQDVREHEVAKALVQALAVNGVSTMLLKASTNTHGPDGDGLAWPSGHTSSSFTVAAVLNEYYGPWVGVPSFALAGLVGYQRIDSRAHDFSDVVVGAMLGYVIGTSVARDDKAGFPELWGMTVLPFNDPETNSSGLALYKQW